MKGNCEKCNIEGVEIDLLHRLCTDCVLTTIQRERIATTNKAIIKADDRLSLLELLNDRYGDETEKTRAFLGELLKESERLRKVMNDMESKMRNRKGLKTC